MNASPRVFLVDDDEIIVDLVREAVQGEGWAFQAKTMVAGSLEAIGDSVPDIILLDVSLPDGDGYSLCDGLRADRALADIPVIFLTSKDQVANRVKGFAVGAQDYVVKPFAVEELLARMRTHLELKAKRDVIARKLIERDLCERVRQDVMDMVVHDLRAPLATVKCTLDLIKMHGLVKQDPYARLLNYAEDSVQFALLMVNDLLDLGAGQLKVEAAPLDLPALFKRWEDLFAVQFKGQNVTLKLEPPESLGVSSDPALLSRIMINLISNALKFSPAGGTVIVAARPSPAGLRLEVHDDGPGIPQAEQDAIFMKYYRVQNSQAELAPGSGIGLAFCRMAAEALGGKIWVVNNPGSGSRFTVELPSLAAQARKD